MPDEATAEPATRRPGPIGCAPGAATCEVVVRGVMSDDEHVVLEWLKDRVPLTRCESKPATWALADIAAKRLIIAEHQPGPAIGYLLSRPGAFGCARCHLDEGVIEPEGWCLTIRALALPYAEHPGCHPSWLPRSDQV